MVKRRMLLTVLPPESESTTRTVSLQSVEVPVPKWRRMLEKEMAERSAFEGLSELEWLKVLRGRGITSANHDTVLSLDWPHFCATATEACGGAKGWCYTFTGLQAGGSHVRKVAMVDALAVEWPGLFAKTVVAEVGRAVASGAIPYPNLRYSGSGELRMQHLEALANISAAGITLWGFTKNIAIARALRSLKISVIFSHDCTTDRAVLSTAVREEIPLAYISSGVDDRPNHPCVVVFPLHRSGRVGEIADVPMLCPKVVHEYLNQVRPAGSCQIVCQRCHAQ